MKTERLTKLRAWQTKYKMFVLVAISTIVFLAFCVAAHVFGPKDLTGIIIPLFAGLVGLPVSFGIVKNIDDKHERSCKG